MVSIRLGSIFSHGFFHYPDPAGCRRDVQRLISSRPSWQPLSDMWVVLEVLDGGEIMAAPCLCEWSPSSRRKWRSLDSEERGRLTLCRDSTTNLRVRVALDEILFRRYADMSGRGFMACLRPSDVVRCQKALEDRERPYLEALAAKMSVDMGDMSASEVYTHLRALMILLRKACIKNGRFDCAALTDEQLFRYLSLVAKGGTS